MNTQFWLIGLSNTIHLLFTVVWIGWSVLLALVVAPRLAEVYHEENKILAILVKRLPVFAYGALGVLGATGMVQMSAHPNYDGLFAITSTWGRFLFAKHTLIIVSIILICYLGLSLTPQLKLAVRRERLGKTNKFNLLASRFRMTAWLNFLTGLAILLITGFMTALH